MIDENTLRRGCEALGIILTDEQVRQFLTYYEFLVEKNQVMNLTAITEYEEVVQKHFVDSLSIVKVCDMKQVQTLIDVGTGAGFPGDQTVPDKPDSFQNPPLSRALPLSPDSQACLSAHLKTVHACLANPAELL